MRLLSPLLSLLPLLLAPDAGKLEEQANLRLEILHLLDVPLHPRLDQFRLRDKSGSIFEHSLSGGQFDFGRFPAP